MQYATCCMNVCAVNMAIKKGRKVISRNFFVSCVNLGVCSKYFMFAYVNYIFLMTFTRLIRFVLWILVLNSGQFMRMLLTHINQGLWIYKHKFKSWRICAIFSFRFQMSDNRVNSTYHLSAFHCKGYLVFPMDIWKCEKCKNKTNSLELINGVQQVGKNVVKSFHAIFHTYLKTENFPNAAVDIVLSTSLHWPNTLNYKI